MKGNPVKISTGEVVAGQWGKQVMAKRKKEGGEMVVEEGHEVLKRGERRGEAAQGNKQGK